MIKGGFIAWAQMGDPNASIPTPQPSYMRPMFGALGRAIGATSIAFVSQRAVAEGHIAALGLAKRVNHVRRCRGIGKVDMKLNDALPVMKIDPEIVRGLRRRRAPPLGPRHARRALTPLLAVLTR